MFIRTVGEHGFSPKGAAETLRGLYAASGKESLEDYWRNTGDMIYSVVGANKRGYFPSLVTDRNQVRVVDPDLVTIDFGEVVPVTIAFFLREVVHAVTESISSVLPIRTNPKEQPHLSQRQLLLEDGNVLEQSHLFVLKYPARIFEIVWAETDNLRAGFGHGVEFYHVAIADRQSGRAAPIAVIEGYGWLHNPLQKLRLYVECRPSGNGLF